MQKLILHITVSMIALFYKQWDFPLFFCEFNLFVSIKYLLNLFLLPGEACGQSFISTKFNQNLIVGAWSMANTSTNLYENRYNTFCDILATEKRTNKQFKQENKQTGKQTGKQR